MPNCEPELAAVVATTNAWNAAKAATTAAQALEDMKKAEMDAAVVLYVACIGGGSGTP